MEKNIENITPENAPNLAFAEPLEIAKTLVHVLDMKKGRDIKLLRVADKTIIADYFVICGGTSNTNIKALAGEAEYKLGLCGVTPIHIDGYSEGEWIVVDFGSVMVHIMNRDNRDFYKLEKLWSEAESIDISDIIVQ